MKEIESKGYYRENSTIYLELKSQLEKLQHATNESFPQTMQYTINVAVITKFTDIIKSWIIQEYKYTSIETELLKGGQYIHAVVQSWTLFRDITKAITSIYVTHDNIRTQCDMELLSK